MSYDGYKAYIAEALPEESPKMYGLHPNAEIMFLTTQSNTLFMMLMQLQPRTSATSTSGELSREDRCKAQLEDILDMLPRTLTCWRLPIEWRSGHPTSVSVYRSVGA